MLATSHAIHLEWLLALSIAMAVASAWRGAWLAIHAVLLPESLAASATASLVIGSALFFACAALQQPLAAWCRSHPDTRLVWLLDALYTYTGFLCSVLVWRGAWELWTSALDALAPDSPLGGALLSHAAGVLLLLLVGALRSVVAPPMVVSSDTWGPLLGASTTPGLRGFRPLDRCQKPYPQQDAAEWYAAVGIPLN